MLEDKEEIFLCDLNEFLDSIQHGDLDDPLEFAVTLLGTALNGMGYKLASGKGGKTNELWAVKK